MVKICEFIYKQRLWLAIALWLLLAFSLPRLMSAAELAITEIMYNPADSDTGREWLEVKNISTSTLNLVDGSWRYNDGASHLLATSSIETLLLPNSYAVISDDPTKFKIDYPNFAGIIFDSSFTLKNSDSKISLYHNGVEDTSVTYAITLGASDDGKTLEYDWLTNQWRTSYVIGGTPGANESQPPANLPPSLQLNLPSQAEINKEVKFTATSVDPENDPVTLTWNFGDDGQASGVEVTHTYVNDGSFEVVVLATDGVNQVYATATLKVLETVVDTTTPISKTNDWPLVELSEILANPSGSETESEWIELYNNSPRQVNVDRWQLGDGSTKRYTLKTENVTTSISAYGYLLIKRPVSGLSLNNTGEQISLYAPDGSVRDKVTYDKALEDWSFAKSDGYWQWTKTPTPEKLNNIEAPLLEMGDDDELITATVTAKTVEVKAKSAATVPERIKVDDKVTEQVVLSEVFPNPAGKDDNEWLELKNNGAVTVDLFGYYVDDEDGGSKPYYFATTTLILPQQYLLLNKTVTKLSLGNQKDSVRLLANDKKVIWEIKYDQAKENQTYAYDVDNDDWQWTEILTAGKDNKFLNPSMTISAATDNKSTLQAESTNPLQSISEVVLLPDKSEVLVEGVVIAQPGLFGKTTMYIAECGELDKACNGQSVVQVYSSAGEFNNVQLGDVVQVMGVMATSKNERRIKLVSKEKPVVIGKYAELPLEETALDEIVALDTGELVKVSGQLFEKKSSNLIIGSGDNTVTVNLKKVSGLLAKDFTKGDWLTVTAVVDQQNGKALRLLPRQKQDIVKNIVAGVSEVASTSSPVSTQELKTDSVDRVSQKKKIIFSMIGFLIIVTSWEVYKRLRKNK